jgi:pyruvate dehydrogenase E2 component (dihydrolipoamide acetyltransferase)
VALRKALLPKLEERIGVRLTYTDLLVRFCALTLLDHPRVLSQWDNGSLCQTGQVNIGVAMGTPHGLIVPVIHHADRLGLAEIARLRRELSAKAQAGRLLPQDLELGAFTLSNLGMFAVDSFDAILNPPQAAILAVGRIKEKPVVVVGQVIPAPVMNLSLSVDHRVLDGAAGARFLGDLVELIETPGLVMASQAGDR